MSLKTLLQKIFDSPVTPDSDADRLLQQFDAEHPEKSDTQQKEIARQEKIARLRDKA